MKKLVLCLVLCATLFSGAAQTDSRITLGAVESISSKILNEDRKVWVYVPGNVPNDLSGPKKYPVVYLLDGDLNFSAVVSMLQQLSRNNICPEMIVVGITNTDRTRDMTPTHISGPIPLLGNIYAKTSGGSERFLSFIEKELMPYIESKYPTEPYKMFIGHSLGGLTIMDALINHSEMFNSYVCIDPGIWWDNQKLLRQAPKVLAEKSFEGKSVFLAIANTMPLGMDIAVAKRDTSLQTLFFRSILSLDTVLQQNASNKLRYKSKYYQDDNHGSVPFIAEYDAFRFIFDFYRLNLANEDFENFSAATLNKIVRHYEQVSKNLGYTVKLPEMMANGLGYRLLMQKKFKESEMVFSLNLKNYPQSFNVYDSMGEFYETVGEKQKAIDYYKKALSLKEFPGTREKLNLLLKN